MTSKLTSTNVNLFQNATLTVGRSGDAQVERTIDPKTSRINISHADQFSTIDAIPLREGSSDVVVREQSMQAAQHGMEAKLAHYAKHGGSVEIDGQKAKVTGYQNGILSLESGGAERLVNLFTNEGGVKFGAVKTPFVERKSPTVTFELGNVEGKDALHLKGSVSSSADVSYRVTIADASNQDAIKAELQPRVSIANNSGVDFEKMSLALRLNEPEPVPSYSPRKARSFGLESVMAADAVGPTTEGEVSGVITMPIRAKTLDLAAGETKLLNFAGAVNGTPNADMAFVPVTLKQTLELGFDAVPGKVGKSEKQKGSPTSKFEMAGTKGQQPAGSYELYDGKDRAGQATTSRYTEKNTAVNIPGNRMTSIQGESKSTTIASQAGEWSAVDVGGGAVPTRRRPDTQYTRTVTEEMKQEVELSSKSQHARTIDMSIRVGAFDEGVSNVVVKVGGAEVPAKIDEELGAITFRAPVPANGKSNVEVTFTGKRTEAKFGDE